MVTVTPSVSNIVLKHESKLPIDGNATPPPLPRIGNNNTRNIRVNVLQGDFTHMTDTPLQFQWVCNFGILA